MTAQAQPHIGVVISLSQQPTATGVRNCSAELSSDLLDLHGQVLDGIIGLVFDTLNAQHLSLRVVVAGPLQPTVHCAPAAVARPRDRL